MATSKKKSKKKNFKNNEVTPLVKKKSSKIPSIKPSKVDDLPWLYAERKKGKYPEATDNSGKWLIYVWKHNLDLVWEKIRLATEKGILGFAAKVSTAMPSPLAPKENLGVICVYTYDFTD